MKKIFFIILTLFFPFFAFSFAGYILSVPWYNSTTGQVLYYPQGTYPPGVNTFTPTPTVTSTPIQTPIGPLSYLVTDANGKPFKASQIEGSNLQYEMFLSQDLYVMLTDSSNDWGIITTTSSGKGLVFSDMDDISTHDTFLISPSLGEQVQVRNNGGLFNLNVGYPLFNPSVNGIEYAGPIIPLQGGNLSSNNIGSPLAPVPTIYANGFESVISSPTPTVVPITAP